MDLANGDGNLTSSELLQAQDYIWNHLLNYVNSMCLKCAIELGIPDLIHDNGQPMTLLELISALHIHPTKAHGIRRVMRILVHSGFFELRDLEKVDHQTGYALTVTSRLLLKNNPSNLVPLVLVTLHPFVMAPGQYLGRWLKDGENLTGTAAELAHGGRSWELMKGNPELDNLFYMVMENDSTLMAKVVLDTCGGVFEGLSSVVDVGGGTGIMGKAIADAFPHLECTVIDMPHVVNGLVGSERLKFVAGDMFVEIPPADALLLKLILHDWNDEKCIEILKRSKEALSRGGKGGKLIVIDIVVDNQGKDHRSTETQFLFDITLMVGFNGKERSEKEWAKLFLDAGFSGYKIISRLGIRSLIEVYP